MVRDALYLSPREGVPPTMYVSLLQRPRNNPPAINLAMRVARDRRRRQRGRSPTPSCGSIPI